MKVINLYGSSGAGKSTAAAGLTYELKSEGLKVETINEYAKELCILNSQHLLENQTWVFANQYQKMKYLSKDLDFVITDSPLMLASFYGNKYEYEFRSLFPLIEEVYNSFDNINIFLDRNHSWDPYARIQSEEESKQDSLELEIFLQQHRIEYSKFPTGRNLPSILKKHIVDTNMDVIQEHYKKLTKLTE